jgi:primosomal protein N' (replication factor Y)
VATARLDELAVAFLEAIARENGGRDDDPAEPRGTELLGPVDCPISRVKNKFRFHLMLRDRNRPRLHRVLEVFDRLPREARSGLIVDVDAMALL